MHEQSQSGVGSRVGGGIAGVRESGGGKMETIVLEEQLKKREHLQIEVKTNLKYLNKLMNNTSAGFNI